MSAPRAPAGRRRAFSNLGGPAEREGDPALSELLARAFEASSSPDEGREHVHGFHSYPARLHPGLASRLIRDLCPEGGGVFDPFCGSGTVLIEARLAGRRSLGVDLNPLAVRLANLKAAGRPAAHLEALAARAQRIAAQADERRRKKAGASRRYPPDDTSAFAPHVLLELDSLRVGIEESPDELRGDLELLLSSLLTKLSLKAGDSAGYQVEKRIAPGFASRLFVERLGELSRQIAGYLKRLPSPAPEARALEGDAQALPSLGAFDLIVTSPPYPGNYDYLQHHEMRLRWLNLDARGLAEREVGARRRLPEPQLAQAQWKGELRACLASMARQLAPGGKAALVIADTVAARQAFYNDDLLREVAPAAGVVVLARASQLRPHFHKPTAHLFDRRPRREHLICVAASPAPPASSTPARHAPSPDRSPRGAPRRRR